MIQNNFSRVKKLNSKNPWWDFIFYFIFFGKTIHSARVRWSKSFFVHGKASLGESEGLYIFFLKTIRSIRASKSNFFLWKDYPLVAEGSNFFFFWKTITRWEREDLIFFLSSKLDELGIVLPLTRSLPRRLPREFLNLHREIELDCQDVLPRVVGYLPRQGAREPLDLRRWSGARSMFPFKGRFRGLLTSREGETEVEKFDSRLGGFLPSKYGETLGARGALISWLMSFPTSREGETLKTCAPWADGSGASRPSEEERHSKLVPPGQLARWPLDLQGGRDARSTCPIGR